MTILTDLVDTPDWELNFTWLIWVAFVFAFAVSYGMGANDACNDWGTSVGAGTVKLWQVTETIRMGIVDVSVYDIYVEYEPTNHTYVIVPFCQVVNYTGGNQYEDIHDESSFLTLSYDPAFNLTTVINTMRSATFASSENKAIMHGEVTTFAPPPLPPLPLGNETDIVECARYTEADFMYAQVGTLLGVSVFMIVSSVFKIPVSATHAIVGATLAASLYLKGNNGIQWLEIGGIVLSWFISPLLAGFVSSVFYLIVKFSVLMRRHTFEAALNLCPIFMAFTLTVNLFACIFDGSKYYCYPRFSPDLGFDKLPWWAALLISLGVGCGVGLLMHFVLGKWLRGRAIRLYERDLKKKAKETRDVRDAEESSESSTETPSGSTDRVVDVSFTVINGERIQLPAGEIEPPPGPWYKYIRRNVTEDPLAAKVFNAVQMVSASLLSFSLGANDTANTVGPLVAIWLTYKTGWALTDASTRADMQYLLLFGAAAMIVGFVTLGHRTMKLIAKEITTEVSAPSGFTVELGTAFTVLFCAKLGIPVSSTHCAVGAVLFVGMTKSTHEGVDWKVFGKIVVVWLLCFPISALISFIMTVILYNFV
ncbi:hypothetical protein PRIPAC_78277 [Pristionchus pacificus]|uniref:Phosphate transporter n=1 Tax=Pristionchus pacificus TaxID=54126 RepID=A0A2A6C4H7_PRIPA|nr:hypothetical protein PRIPAC_78277 [Pristionchus pacificus]|eukprot:PDM73039.1 hypothetical protein PRIPAC_39473 [Pristionchus pacificus]